MASEDERLVTTDADRPTAMGPPETLCTYPGRPSPVRRQLADELFLSLCTIPAGQCRPGRGSGAGHVLAGGLLGELVLAGKAVVEHGRIHVVDARPSPDPLLHQLIAVTLAEPDALGWSGPWLEHVGLTADAPASDLIAARLAAAGVLIRAPRRSRGIALPFALARPQDARGPLHRIDAQLSRGGELSDQDCLLAALLDSGGLFAAMFPASKASRDALRAQIAGLPFRLAEVVLEVRVATAKAILS